MAVRLGRAPGYNLGVTESDDDETILMDSAGALLSGDFSAKTVLGHVTLTRQRLVFGEQKPTTAGIQLGALGSVVDDLRKRRQVEHAPLVDVPLADITAVSKRKFRLNRNILVVELADGRKAEVTDSFKQLDAPLRKVLTEEHGKTIQQDAPEGWRVA